MDTSDVLEVLDRLEAAGVAVWLDGGWGVDALLGEQTRPHDDLDLVVDAALVDRAIEALAGLGFSMHRDERPTAFVLRDPSDRRVDFHPVAPDGEGGGLQRQPDGSDFRYPAEGLAGHGEVAGRPVRCLSAELQVMCHAGYEPDEGDRRDVGLLHERFGVALPPPYGRE